MNLSKRSMIAIFMFLLLMIGAGGCDDTDDPPAHTITVTGPITGGLGKPYAVPILNLAAHGYLEEEFFFEGYATAYKLQGEMTMNGKWTLNESTKEYFKSRMLVRRPVDAGKFNGTVVLEWLNVSAGIDADPGFMYNWQEILREGYAWIGVSAQAVGVEGGGFAMVEGLLPLKEHDPERYGSLVHPGDDYCYDIYTLAARVVRNGGDVDVLKGLKPKRLIAYGESQSAICMISYVNGVHPLAKAFNGYFIHSRMAGGMPFGSGGLIGMLFSTNPVQVRDDIYVPVFQFETETDVIDAMGIGGFYSARQADSDRIRTWEVAGTAHADQYVLDYAQFADAEVETMAAPIACKNVNDGPQQFVLKAALHALNLWVSDGIAPPTAEPLRMDQEGNPVVDEHGNTLGGVRTPDVDVPIATLSGQAADDGSGTADMLCILFGSTTPFASDKLAALYPTHADYVTKVKASARQAREAGFILEHEEQAIIAEAEAAPIPY